MLVVRSFSPTHPFLFPPAEHHRLGWDGVGWMLLPHKSPGMQMSCSKRSCVGLLHGWAAPAPAPQGASKSVCVPQNAQCLLGLGLPVLMCAQDPAGYGRADHSGVWGEVVPVLAMTHPHSCLLCFGSREKCRAVPRMWPSITCSVTVVSVPCTHWGQAQTQHGAPSEAIAVWGGWRGTHTH